MSKRKVEIIMERHYRDMLDLNRRFIQTMGRPRLQPADIQNLSPVAKKKLTKKQLTALARGRKILSLKRSNSRQI